MEELNTLNGVRPEVVDGQKSSCECGSEGREPDRRGNAAQGSGEPSPARTEQSPSENSNFAKLRRENDALKKELETLRSEPKKPGTLDHIPLALERERFRKAAFESRYGADLREIRAAYPEEKIGHIRELGKQYFALRRCGVENLAAYNAVRAATAAFKKSPPPSIGPVGMGETSRDFFTGAELDRLSDRELSNPKVLEKAVKSLTRLKKR